VSEDDAPTPPQVGAPTAKPAAPSRDYPPANLARHSGDGSPRVSPGELAGGGSSVFVASLQRPRLGSREWGEHILGRTPECRCPASRYVLVNLRTGRSFGVLCKSWSCSYCQKRKWVAVAALLYNGIERAWDAGERVRLLTLTDGSGAGMTVSEVSAAWDKLAKLLKRGGPAPERPAAGSGADAQAAWRDACKSRVSYLSEYAMVLEVGGNVNRQLHAHVLATGRFIYQAGLAQWAAQCGFGRIADVREVSRGDAREVGGYAAKQLAGYASKTGQALALADRGGERLRPVRLSRGWYGGGLRRAEEELGFRAPPTAEGTERWFIIRHDADRAFVSAEPL
jgi:hypothetical protein